MSNMVKKWAKRLFWAALIILLLQAGFTALLWTWVARPPDIPIPADVLQRRVETAGERRVLGDCWAWNTGGLRVMYLAGTPFEIGFANGRLTEDLMHNQEAELIQLMNGSIPWAAGRLAIKVYATWFTRNLSDSIPAEYREELYGISKGCRDNNPGLGPYYHRLMNYHAAHDLSHLLMDSALLSRCTAFGAWGGATADGHLLTGRNFDWEAARSFEKDRVLAFFRPEKGLAFLSLSWGGMVGAVSGMNEAGISVTVNGANGKPPARAGTPISIVVRQVLQYARNLDEAAAIVSNSTVFVSEHFLVGSKSDNRFIVIEKTPAMTAVREGSNSVIICANHFMTAPLRDIPQNVEYLKEGTSAARYDRMLELALRAWGRITPKETLAILRDRRLPGDFFPGNGHRGTINALIATHSVIMDLTGGIFWAATPPHQLGRFMAFRFEDFERRPHDLDFEADPMAGSGEYSRLELSRQHLDRARKDLASGELEQALAWAEKAEANNPGFYQNAWLTGRILERLGRGGEAAKALQAAMQARPAFHSERMEIEALLKTLARGDEVNP